MKDFKEYRIFRVSETSPYEKLKENSLEARTVF